MAIILKDLNRLDHPSVQSVIEIAENIIHENKVLDATLLYNRAKKQLKIPRKGLLSIIQMLINRKILVEGSKYTKESVLSNRNRAKIYNFIKTHLGAHFSLIRKNAFYDNVGNIGSPGQLIWHLEMLLKFNYIKKVKIQNKTIFIPIETDEEFGILYYLLKDDLNKKIIDLLIKQDKIKRLEVHKHINEKRENIYYRINVLIDYDIISLIEEESNEIYLNPKNKDIIVKVLNKLQI